MKLDCIHACLIAAALLFTSGVAQAQHRNEPPILPRELFFGPPAATDARISPDGRMIGFLAPIDGILNVWVRSVGGDDAVPVTDLTERPVAWWRWAENSAQVIYAADLAGEENFRIFATDIDLAPDVGLDGSISMRPTGGPTLLLTPERGVRARLVASDRSAPDHILVAINERDPRYHDVWKINTRTSEREEVYRNEAGYSAFIADSALDIRAVERLTREGGRQALVRDTADGPWFELAVWNLDDAAASRTLGFSRDGRSLYLAESRRRDTAALYELGRDARGRAQYLSLADDPQADLSDVVFHPATGRPQAAAFDHARRRWVVIDPRVATDWARLESLADGGDFRIVSRDHRDRLWTVEVDRAASPPDWFLYNRSSGDITLLFNERPQLASARLAPMRPVSIRARDGLPLVGYLSIAPGFPARNRPMVLLVHGGPWSRDRWGFNPRRQWLANRGYAVLSVNFRGSTGFGKQFVAAGNREWAGTMHNDLIDASIWAVDQRIADPDRIAIMGASYGGYATLVGLTFTPEFFAAGVDIVGPSNLETLLKTIPPYWEPIRALFEARMGSLDNPNFLQSISPLSRVDRIVRPLLIGQGANDPRVKMSESDQIVNAMLARDIPVTYIVFPDEGHGFRDPRNAIAFYAVTESFLATHLGGRAEPIGDALAESSAEVRATGEQLAPEVRGEPE